MNKHYFFIAAAFITLGLNSNAQLIFQQSIGMFNSQFGYSGQQTTDGGYIIAGTTENVSNIDPYLVKTDSSGAVVWTKIYYGGNEDRCYSVQQTSDGGYILCGFSFSYTTGLNDIYIIKTNTIGDTLWTKHFGGSTYDGSNCIRQTSDGGYVVVGSGNSYGAGSGDIYLLKLDSNGNGLWARTYGGIGDDWGGFVQQTTDGGYVISGSTNSYGVGGYDALLIRTDGNGDTLWTRTYGGTSDDGGGHVQGTTDGGYILTGYTTSSGAGLADAFLIKTDGNGNATWSRTYGGADDDGSTSVQQTADGGYVLGGSTKSFGAGMQDAYVLRTDGNGDTLWTRTYGGGNDDHASVAQQTSDGGHVAIGTVGSFGVGYPDIFLIKTESNGNSGCDQYTTVTVVGNPAMQVTSPAFATSAIPSATIAVSPSVSSNGGSTLYCTNLGVSGSPLNEASLSVSPNPFTDEIRINSKFNVEIVLFDPTGKVIIHQPSTAGEVVLSTERIARGFYLLRCFDGRTSVTSKVLKQ